MTIRREAHRIRFQGRLIGSATPRDSARSPGSLHAVSC